jgi:hypothetical protein
MPGTFLYIGETVSGLTAVGRPSADPVGPRENVGKMLDDGEPATDPRGTSRLGRRGSSRWSCPARHIPDTMDKLDH